jgi:hypothetical protein
MEPGPDCASSYALWFSSAEDAAEGRYEPFAYSSVLLLSNSRATNGSLLVTHAS